MAAAVLRYSASTSPVRAVLDGYETAHLTDHCPRGNARGVRQ
jgi:hypothetical protein